MKLYNDWLTFLNDELILICFVNAAPALLIHVQIPADADPRSALTAAVAQHILAVVYKFDLCMFLTQICRLNVHSQIYLFWVPWTEKFPIRRRVDEKEFATENAVSAFKKVVVITRFTYLH